MSSQERTGWRDSWPSAWHRQLGPNMPQTDVDSLWYHYGSPVAIVDWKQQHSGWKPSRSDASTKAQLRLANGYQSETHPAGLPFYVITYWPTELHWRWWPMNPVAVSYLATTESFPTGSMDSVPYLDTSERLFILISARVRGLSKAQTQSVLAYVQEQPLPGASTIKGVPIRYNVTAQRQRAPWSENLPDASDTGQAATHSSTGRLSNSQLH